MSEFFTRVFSAVSRRSAATGKNLKRAIGFGLLIAVSATPAVPARAEYKVGAGDVIEIFVTRVPELQRRAPVNVDGQITFPLIGTLPVAGLSLAQLQNRIKSELAAKVVQQRTPDGRDIDLIINPDDVTAAVVEYRPVYVNGDVSKPGEYPFRPAMTARHAIAVSGGYFNALTRILNPAFEVADLRGEFEALWAELAKEQARVWRIKSELGTVDNSDKRTMNDIPLPKDTITRIVELEDEQLAVRRADHQRQQDFLKRSIEQSEDQVKVLSEQQKSEEEGVNADSEELRKMLQLFEKGQVVSPRITDARRAVMLSSTRKLQTVAQLMQVRRQQDELVRQVEKLNDQRRMDLLAQLQEAGGKVNALRPKIQGVSEKLRFLAHRAEANTAPELKPDIAIIRKQGTGLERIASGEDTELQPGDVVEVKLRAIPYSEAAGQ